MECLPSCPDEVMTAEECAQMPAVQYLVQAKMEYHGNKASDAEEVTAEELVRWWSAAHIRPGAHVLVRAALYIECIS